MHFGSHGESELKPQDAAQTSASGPSASLACLPAFEFGPDDMATPVRRTRVCSTSLCICRRDSSCHDNRRSSSLRPAASPGLPWLLAGICRSASGGPFGRHDALLVIIIDENVLHSLIVAGFAIVIRGCWRREIDRIVAARRSTMIRLIVTCLTFFLHHAKGRGYVYRWIK